ncbi:MAG: site-2 protease family protein [Candidatus Harrisonbacteria bacterium]|nr:site-2 protease family protein [Candidatus Harrisonbacteria bacterium]
MLVLLPIFIFSIVLHEVAHGLMALKFGDDTAQRAGRLTLNPLPHIDLIGSILIPVMGMLLGGMIIGWAKPVPVDFDRLNEKETIYVSLAGVAVNFLMATAAGLALRLLPLGSGYLPAVITYIVFINLMLGVFNLLPVPPLDGWRIWGIWLPENVRWQIEANALLYMALLFIILPLLPIIPLVRMLFFALTGVRL